MEPLLVLAILFGCPAIAAGVPVVAIALVGLHRRKQLEQDIAAREQRVAHLLAVTTPEFGPGRQVTLVMGSMVYAPDGAARLRHRWRGLFGGRSESMSLRMESARRMATVRALEQASQQGARAVLNLRYESAALGLGQSRTRSGGLPLIEIVAYGTAWMPPA